VGGGGGGIGVYGGGVDVEMVTVKVIVGVSQGVELGFAGGV
jgi:hypothetical protein